MTIYLHVAPSPGRYVVNVVVGFVQIVDHRFSTYRGW